MGTDSFTRRRFLGATAALPWLAGCGTPLPLADANSAGAPGNADALLRQSAEAHGLGAYRELHDINVRYEGQWRPLIDRVQPVIVDKAFRGSSEERLIPAAGLIAQAYAGSAGGKHVVWRRAREPAVAGEVAVWFNDQRTSDEQALDAAALVAEGYGLFLLGPLWLAGGAHPSSHAGSATVDGRTCDVVDVRLRPGLGHSTVDRVQLYIDSSGWMRRVRFTLEGFAGTRGAVAQVDTFDHERRFGVLWPMRSYEEVVHPVRMPAHDWRITGLDVDRGYQASDVMGARFVGAAEPAAARI